MRSALGKAPAQLAEYRVGLVLDHPAAPVTSEVGAVLSDLADDLARAGVEVVEGWPDGVDPVAEAAAFGEQVELFFALQNPESEYGPLGAIVAGEQRRMAARATWERYFREVDVFLSPTSFTAAFPHDDRPFEDRMIDGRPYHAQVFWISHAAFTGRPALSMPVGWTQAGLPIGLQVAGPRYGDDTVITFAELLAG